MRCCQRCRCASLIEPRPPALIPYRNRCDGCGYQPEMCAAGCRRDLLAANALRRK